ncbi:NADH dehydrogenase (ubiquinone) complex I, assembly factor 6 isoform X2 [Zootermopsis nevadensis]|uniref:NADH dehydrogenase (ubiquinone) complex I, assembly factor 6 isoform X2 n=1 Tax=Zootermopsis nevadensis TaxID=136037 RepID=UPI000B8EA32E|nr:NADH dehydrogenase (ubiquinone) complex I, assembly factor 6 isoform X2 [Zootermopsis nevadensis]
MHCSQSIVLRIPTGLCKSLIIKRHGTQNSTSKQRLSADYCLNLVRQHDYENFLCTLLLPSHSRTSAFAIRAFNIEVAKVQDQVSDPHIGQMRMKFWEETVDKIYVDHAPSHPVAVELHHAIRRRRLSKRYLKRLITVRADHLRSAVFPDLEAVESYAEHSVSSVYYLLLEASGVESIHADHAASHLGKAHGIVNLIRSVPFNAPRKIVSLPQDVLLQHNVPHETVLRAKCTADLKEAVFDVAARAKQHLNKLSKAACSACS